MPLHALDRTPAGREAPGDPAALGRELAERLGGGEHGVSDAVDALLSAGVAQGASDIHLEPRERSLSIRFRIDGMLHEAAAIERRHHPKIVARLKVLARIVVYQRDLPQDGRIDPGASPCGKAMRVSTFPTVHGEKVVVRILDMNPDLFRLEALGFLGGGYGGSPARSRFAAGHTAADRPELEREDHHDLCLPAGIAGPGAGSPAHHHHRGPGGIPARRGWRRPRSIPPSVLPLVRRCGPRFARTRR